MTQQESHTDTAESAKGLPSPQTRPKPPVGLELNCAAEDILFLGSNVPCVRVVQRDDLWVTSDDRRRGLVVRILKPTRLSFAGGIRIRITSTHVNFAHAEAICA